MPANDYAPAKMFLTDEDLAALTGYRLAAYQVKWLDAHNFPYELTGLGRPRVLRAYVERRLGLKGTVAPKKRDEPDFSHWKRK